MTSTISLGKISKSLTFLQKFQLPTSDEDGVPFYKNWIEPSLCVSPGAILLHKHLQKVISLPIEFKTKETVTAGHIHRVQLNSNYFTCLQTLIRTTNLSLIFSVFIICIGLLFWVKSHWSNTNNLEQLFLYMVFVCMIYIGLSAWYALDSNKISFVFITAQRLKMVPVKNLDFSSTQKSIGDIFMFGFGLSCASFPLLVLLLPLKLDYDPLSMLFRLLTEVSLKSVQFPARLVIQLLIGFLYVSLTTYGAGIFLSLMMLSLVIVEGLQLLSRSLYPRFSTERMYFTSAYKTYRIIQQQITIANYAVKNFLFGLVVMGVAFAGSCAYATLMMYNDLPIITYLACPVILLVALTVDFVLIGFANIPHRDVKTFRKYWQQVVKLKVDRKRLVSCPPLWYNIGPIKVELITALLITNGILNFTVNLVLLKAMTRP